ncbi:unnamed protein product [Rotaria sordida]|uniref:Kelch domain-containing protein 3 n=1 Tax=Rotaria sordida TaxID=392033 RepID=A0A814CSS2_9BILA|nr:unnamed protein product [Rotaria sordida]
MYWIQCIENGPRRVNHAAGALDDFIYSFGGYSHKEDYTRITPIDIHICNTHTLKWYLLPKPQLDDSQYNVTPFSRYGHTVVVYKRKFYLWGGRNDRPVPCNRLFCFDPKSRQWSLVSIVGDFVPSPRDGHSACIINDRMYIFGGFEDHTQQFSNDLFYFDFNTSSWHLHQPKIGDVIPQWRDFHSATNLDGQMYLFGGRFDRIEPQQITQTIYDDRLYIFNPEHNSWSLVTAMGEIPCGRRSHSAFVHDGKLYIFGGYNNVIGSHFNDLHEFNPLTLLWRRIKAYGIGSPVPRRRQCCLVIHDRMYMFGGTSPISTSTFTNRSNEIQEIDVLRTTLYDQSDLYVFDFAPTLKTLCLLFLAKQRININILSKKFHQEYQLFTQSTLIRQRSTGETSG